MFFDVTAGERARRIREHRDQPEFVPIRPIRALAIAPRPSVTRARPRDRSRIRPIRTTTRRRPEGLPFSLGVPEERQVSEPLDRRAVVGIDGPAPQRGT